MKPFTGRGFGRLQFFGLPSISCLIPFVIDSYYS